jgi:hypothetical protein
MKKLITKIKRWWTELQTYEFHRVDLYNEDGEMKMFIDMDEVIMPENSSAQFIAKLPKEFIEQLDQFKEDVEEGNIEEV